MNHVQEFRCLLVSPSDVEAERAALQEVANRWNAQIGQNLRARIELVRWESHSVPDLSGAPQKILNRQLLPECDFAIAVFWSRAGTPTVEHVSGSMEEIHLLLAAGVRVMVYFNRGPIPQERLDLAQFESLCALRRELEVLGIVGYYDSIGELREHVYLHATNVVSGFLASYEARAAPPPPVVATAAIPDVRVAAAWSIIAAIGDNPRPFLEVSVENHSPMAVFITSVLLELHDGQNFLAQHDGVTDQLNSQRRLEPGERYAFHFVPKLIADITPPAGLRRAVAKDALGRKYVSDELEFEAVIKELFGSH